jgi:hypothetical protein
MKIARANEMIKDLAGHSAGSPRRHLLYYATEENIFQLRFDI